MEIRKATLDEISEVARLFDLYRQFYECEPDLELATDFIASRISNNESTIFAAMQGPKAMGFVQLYASFCSVEAIRIQILYDLYVEASARGKGVGEQLMNRASRFTRESGASRIDLSTAHSNSAGQRLYEKLGYKIVDAEFHSYSLYL
jgi:ribosomal protein S18 acetylase RimI-like enzyme